jgi:hypothetical protein
MSTATPSSFPRGIRLRNACSAISAEWAKLDHAVKAIKLRLQLRLLRFGLLQDGDVGVGVLPEGKEVLVGSLYCCGSPTFRTNSANRGSERIGSSKKSVFKRIKLESRSR